MGFIKKDAEKLRTNKIFQETEPSGNKQFICSLLQKVFAEKEATEMNLIAHYSFKLFK